MLRLDELSVGYRGTRGAVLGDLVMTVAKGAFICVLGRNGAGKSTLMRTLAGLQLSLRGRVLLDAQDVHRMAAVQRARLISVVLTERATSPGLTVQDVMELARQPFTGWTGSLSSADREVLDEALSIAGALNLKRRNFDDLSDGERQRVMIARAMAQTAQLVILDEITAFLDLPGRVEVMALLREHAHRTGAVVVLSSHDLDLSLQLADTVWLLDGTGGLVAGTADGLAAQGSIGAAFDSQRVRFSPAQRRFELRLG